MRLYEELTGIEGFATARYTVAVNGGGYFEGVQAVGDFTDTKIVLYFSRASVQIDGVDLAIGKYCDGDLRLKGKIRAVQFLNKDGAPI